jgi:hypothetical protein
MAKVRTLQASYVAGEFDPTLEGRADIDDYSQGADKLRNVYVRPQGGAFRREGLEYYAPVINDATARIIPFQFNDEQTYVLIVTAASIDVYRSDTKTLQATISSSPITNITEAMLPDLNWSQSADTLLLFHKDLETIKITRTSHVNWTATVAGFTNIPPHAYGTISTATPSGSILPDVFSGQVEIYAESTPFSASDVGQFINTPKGGRIYITEFVSSSHVNGVVRIELESTDSSAQTGTVTPSGTTGSITLTASEANTFLASQVGHYVRTAEGGIAVITGYTSGTVVNATVLKTLEASTAIDDWNILIGYDGWELETGYEDAMSASRGWPRSGSFHKSRLVLGGLKERPQTILMSKIGDFFNFDIGEGLDDEAIDVTIDDDQVNTVRGIFSGRGLSIFTSGGEFSISSDINSAITPGNIADQMQKETRHGSSSIRPVSVDGSIVFVEREDPNTAGSGRIVRQFIYNDIEQSFSAPNISVFSQHLISNPVAMDIRRSTEAHPSNYLYMVNDDGTCAVLNSLREQKLLAWTLFETEGLLEDVAVSGNKTFFIVKRTINSVEKRFLEVLNEDNQMDCSITQSAAATTSWTGLDHLDNEEVRIMGDGYMLEDETPSGGAITSSESVSDLEAGFSFLARVKHLPLNVIIEGQSWVGELKNPVFVNIRMYNSRALKVKHGAQTVCPQLDEFETTVNLVPPTLYTKWQKVYIGGVGREVSVEITQDDPYEFNILATHFAVRVS